MFSGISLSLWPYLKCRGVGAKDSGEADLGRMRLYKGATDDLGRDTNAQEPECGGGEDISINHRRVPLHIKSRDWPSQHP